MVSSSNVEQAKAAFTDVQGLAMVTGGGCLGGFIGSPEAQSTWVGESITNWANAVSELATVASKCPQTACAGFSKSLQWE